MAHQDGQRARVVDERPGRQYERHEALPSVTPELRDQDAEEQRAEERQEELGDPPLVGTIELVGPSGDGDPRRQEAHQIQDGPVAPPREVERAHHEQRVVREERDLGVRAAADEERRREPAADGHERETERVLSIGEPRRADSDQHEQQKRRRLADQLVVAERGVDRQIQDREAAARQDLPVCAISAGGEAMPDRRQHEAADAAHGDAHGLGDPVVVEGVLQKEGDAQHQDDGADPEQQTTANRGFERRMRLRRALVSAAAAGPRVRHRRPRRAARAGPTADADTRRPASATQRGRLTRRRHLRRFLRTPLVRSLSGVATAAVRRAAAGAAARGEDATPARRTASSSDARRPRSSVSWRSSRCVRAHAMSGRMNVTPAASAIATRPRRISTRESYGEK